MRNRTIYNLGMVSGPVLLKIKGTSGVSYFRGLINKNNERQMKTIDEIGQVLVSGALDDTKKRRKAGADIFAKIALDKPEKTKKHPICLRDFPNFPVDLA